MKDKITILGCRGSVPRSGRGFEKYGGATSCYALRLGGKLLLVDAGTGILRLEDVLLAEKSADVILTHAHADHVIGLPMARPAHDPSFAFRIFAKTRNGLDAKAQTNAMLKPPAWPVDTDALAAGFSFFELEDGARFGGEDAEALAVTVDSMEAVHPGGCSILRFRGAGKTVVIATDCEIDAGSSDGFVSFASGADVLLIDGQYDPCVCEKRKGFGHNSWLRAAQLGERCGAVRTYVVHHDPYSTDDVLDRARGQISESFPGAYFAFDGEEIML
jgi:phosphoribosyl 1,2-cyclic phosphodiesterase